MQEEHLEPVPATEKSMSQISGALVGITSVNRGIRTDGVL